MTGADVVRILIESVVITAAVVSVFWRSLHRMGQGRYVSIEIYERDRKANDSRYDALHTHYLKIETALTLLQKDVSALVERNILFDRGWKPPMTDPA